MMLKKGLLMQQDHGRALLPVFLEQMMISPKINKLCSYNRMMKLLKKYRKNNNPEHPASPPKG